MAHKHWKLVEEEEPAHGKCPHCGYCSCCGREAVTSPYYPYPFTPYYPTYPSGPVWISYGTTTAAQPALSSFSTTIIS